MCAPPRSVRHARPPCALVALLPLLLLPGCDRPSGGGYAPPDTTPADTVLFPDLFDSTASPDAEADIPEPDTTTPETSPPDASPPDTATPDTATPDTSPTCVEGSGCNDGDPCTLNDRCQSGVCRGDPLPCNDNLPCTTDSCSGGLCVHTVTTGCLIAGACWSEAQPRPDTPCFACEPAKSTTAWSPLSGTPCNDGDACTANDTCAVGVCQGGPPPPEICDNGLDDNCDGKTDLADLACGGITPCTYHTDCYPERVCAVWQTTGQARCSDPCAGDSDCGAGRICSKVPGSVQVGFCQDAPAGLPNGSGCTLDTQCRSGLCTAGLCTPLCLDESHCAFPGFTCHPVGDLAAGLLQSACSPDPQGARALGQTCTLNGQSYDGGLCASGHCDLMALTPATMTCNTVCKSESDCAPALECNIVIAAPTERPSSLPYDPQFTVRTTDAISACYTPDIPGGTQADGTPCTQRSQCRSNKCLPLIPHSNQAYCTTFCTTDAQCPASMACKLEVVNLVSDWLVEAGAARPGAYSLVRVCKFR